MFCRGSERGTQEPLINTKMIMVFTLNLKLSICYEAIHQLFNLMFLIFLSFSSFQYPRQ